MMTGIYHAPSAALRLAVETYYYYAASIPKCTTVSDRLLSEQVNIRFLLEGNCSVSLLKNDFYITPRCLVFGPNSFPTIVSFTGSFRVFGLGISAVGWASLFDIPLHVLADDAISLAALIGREDANAITERLQTCHSDVHMAMVMDSFLSQRILKRGGMKVSRVVRAIDTAISTLNINRVEELATQIDLSQRQLERVTMENFGFSPKMLLRRQRFLRTARAMRHLKQAPWQDQSVNDYFDQSHLIREFHRFAGETPSQLMARQSPLMDTAFTMQAKIMKREFRESSVDRVVIDTDAMPLAS